MTTPGRCVICTINLRTEVSALRCGHTFHMACISRWLDQAKTCPTCRKRTQIKDIIKLFFDTPEPGQLTQNLGPDEQIARLETVLDSERTENALRADEIQLLNKKIVELESKLKLEKKKSEGLERSREKVHHLENMLHDQQLIKEKLKLCEDRLKASDFYTLLAKSRSGRAVEDKIDKYLNENGSVNDGNFLKLLRMQVADLEKRYDVLMASRNKIEQENKQLKDKAIKYKKIIHDQKKEIAQLRGVDDLESSPAKSSPPRKSLGFRFNDPDYFGDLINSINRDKSSSNLHQRLEDSRSNKRQANELRSKLPEKENEINSKKQCLLETIQPRILKHDQPSTSSRSPPILLDVQIPTPVVKRAIQQPKKISPILRNPVFVSKNARASSDQITPKLLPTSSSSTSKPSTMLKRSSSSNLTINKSGNLMEKSNKNKLKKKQDDGKNMRMSQFFPYKSTNKLNETIEVGSSSQENDVDDIIVIC